MFWARNPDHHLLPFGDAISMKHHETIETWSFSIHDSPPLYFFWFWCFTLTWHRCLQVQYQTGEVPAKAPWRAGQVSKVFKHLMFVGFPAGKLCKLFHFGVRKIAFLLRGLTVCFAPKNKYFCARSWTKYVHQLILRIHHQYPSNMSTFLRIIPNRCRILSAPNPSHDEVTNLDRTSWDWAGHVASSVGVRVLSW